MGGNRRLYAYSFCLWRKIRTMDPPTYRMIYENMRIPKSSRFTSLPSLRHPPVTGPRRPYHAPGLITTIQGILVLYAGTANCCRLPCCADIPHQIGNEDAPVSGDDETGPTCQMDHTGHDYGVTR